MKLLKTTENFDSMGAGLGCGSPVPLARRARSDAPYQRSSVQGRTARKISEGSHAGVQGCTPLLPSSPKLTCRDHRSGDHGHDANALRPSNPCGRHAAQQHGRKLCYGRGSCRGWRTHAGRALIGIGRVYSHPVGEGTPHGRGNGAAEMRMKTRIPNSEQQQRATWEQFGLRASGFFRISRFGFRNLIL